MPDVYDHHVRRRVMQRIRKKDTGPERRVRSLLHALGYRFRLHRSDLPGTPDIVLPRLRLVIQVNGCFWHQHTCPLGKQPKSNLDYWLPKLRRTQERDELYQPELESLGWRVGVIWECETKAPEVLSARIQEILADTRGTRDDTSDDAY